MNWDTTELTEQLAFEISTDAAYLRGDRERLYMSGLEIASMVALGVLGAFLEGVVKGAREAIVKQGEKVGTMAVDAIAAKIDGLVKRLTSARNLSKKEAIEVVDDTKLQLEQVAREPALQPELARQIDSPSPEVLLEVSQYLQVIGYSVRDANDRAMVLVERITIVAKK
jgi:hypothetical protein